MAFEQLTSVNVWYGLRSKHEYVEGFRQIHC